MLNEQLLTILTNMSLGLSSHITSAVERVSLKYLSINK
jgi:hypothetical protein